MHEDALSQTRRGRRGYGIGLFVFVSVVVLSLCFLPNAGFPVQSYLPPRLTSQESQSNTSNLTHTPAVRIGPTTPNFETFLIEPVSPIGISSVDLPLTDFLSSRLKSRPDHLVVAVADAAYTAQALPPLSYFLAELNRKRPTSERHTLLVLCLDAECIDICESKSWLCYSGYFGDSMPPTLQSSFDKVQWTKTRGIADVLEAGYATLFVDADVFFRSDPFESLLKSLKDDTWDIQVQDERHRALLNIGFLYMRASHTAVQLWRQIASRLQDHGGWDQTHFNVILDSTNRRQEGREILADFVSPQGLRVRVLPSAEAFGFHYGWLFPVEAVIVHTTCCDNHVDDKIYIATAHGSLPFVERFISPPRILTVSSLSGTRGELATTMQMLMGAARYSGRAFLPPLAGDFLGPPDSEDDIVRGVNTPNGELGPAPDPIEEPLTLHRRFFWSLFRPWALKQHFPDVQLLEPDFISRATRVLIDHERYEMAREINSIIDLDLRPEWTYEALLDRLDQPVFRNAQVVRIWTDEGPNGFWSRYGSWQYPTNLPRVAPCWQIEKAPRCSEFCREPPMGWLEE